MKRLCKAFLKNYNPQELELFLTARFVMIVIISIIFLASAMIIHGMVLHGFHNITVRVQILNLIVMLLMLGLLIKGYYTIAVHTLFVTVSSTIWTILFFGSDSSIITQLDTIVFIIGVMAVLPIISLNSRKPMIIYFSLNMILFLVFHYYLKKTFLLTTREHWDYFLDNFVVIVFVFLVGYNLFKINQKALTSLKKELNDRKNMEKALLESRHQLSVHLENTPVGVISWDLDFRVTEWNSSAEAIFGYSREEALGKHATDLILPKDMAEQVHMIFQDLVSDSGKGKKSINENITKNKRRIPCEWYNTILKTIDGQIIGVASLVNDITERKKTRELMIQSEKMMSVGGLAAGMAHEINNPLAGIIQNTQVINNRLTKDLPANDQAAKESGTSMIAIKNYMEKRGILNQLDHIHQSGQRANEIIRNMLSFSKKSDLVRKEAHLEELINSTLELAKNDNGFKKHHARGPIEIIREFNPDLPAVFCERTKIQQVLFNLFKNASESINSKSYENEIPKLIIRLKKTRSSVQIEVEDNGTGIDTETCKRVFEPFFTTKGPEKGTGLGLSISYFIVVEEHGGQMEVDSSPGQGSRFIMRLPLRTETC